MKRAVWKNKFNNQLCITIPKGSEVNEGDIVEVKKSQIKCISYMGVVADLFHYGHLQSIQFAKSLSDFNICGIITDEAAESYRIKPIANLQERKAVISSLNCVDKVMVQHARDPTENLKKIHEEFPNAEIILIHGNDLDDVHGADYIKEIGGAVVQHPYYWKLSNFKIIGKILENKDKFKDIKKFTSYIKSDRNELNEEIKNKIIVSSKADTLKTLKEILTKSKIEDLFTFTISDWKNKSIEIIKTIYDQFSPTKIVVRSSAVKEDTLETSMAGCFESVLNIDSSNIKEIEKAIGSVLRSYREKNSESSFNQVLIQKQTENIVMSGVVFTRTLEKNAPYYVINYDDKTGSTDSVTAGRENQTMTLSHFAKDTPEKMKQLLLAIKEIEEKIPFIPLDIEFAVNKNNEIIIFQIRPLAVNIHKEKKDYVVENALEEFKIKFKELATKPNHLSGKVTFFTDMSDWNPAEIIGDNPNYLDYSLYDYLITNSAWHEARTSQGYYNVNPAKLVELFGNKPYINVRNSFNSFTPNSVSPALREKLVFYYLNKLKNNPHLQDKIEFDIAYTCYDFRFKERSSELLKNGFTNQEIDELKIALLNLTNNLIVNSDKDIENDLKVVLSMEEFRSFINKKVNSESQTAKELINHARLLLDECKKKGTVQFSRLARLGFIGKILLKSLVQKGVVEESFFEQVFNSINTVTTKISRDFKKLTRGEISKEDFLKDYYHLRPGTYDITNLRYDMNPNLLQNINLKFKEEKEEKPNFELNDQTAERITEALQNERLNFNAEHFINFVRKATEARELSKFEFTKNLSDSLELIAKAGEKMGFTRKELAQLDINDIFRINLGEEISKITELWKELIKTKEYQRLVHENFVLPSVIFSEKEFDIIEHYLAKPNFITQKVIESKIININENNEKDIPEIEGNIVVLENGDPGYDWIFTRNPAGLITKYGGVASHMSIRCAEFGIPAAIGCGETIFNRVKIAKNALLDCKTNKIIPF